MALFEKGQKKIGGRGKGTRNRFSTKFVEALVADFEEHGEEAIRISRKERPHEYLKIVASLLPKEFEILDYRLTELDDEQLDAFIEYAKRELGNRVASTGNGEGETIN